MAMKKYTARVVEIVHEERHVEFEVDETAADDDEALEEAADQAACDQVEDAKLLGVMDRIVHDIKEVK